MHDGFVQFGNCTMIEMCSQMKPVVKSVGIGEYLSGKFPVYNDLKQVDDLSPLH
jgi:hypothetical protein